MIPKAMPYIADLHVHSKYSRATSKDLDLEHVSRWAQRKGITVVGTGDFTHPAWFAELREKLVPAEDGLFRLRDEIEAAVAREVPAACRRPVRFLLQVEISNIYKKDDRVRKVHNLVYVPDFEAAERFRDALARIGNIASDGRPILGLDSRDLLEITLESSERAFFIPAHIWTPWFSALGARSGFDSIDACFGDLAGHIFAVETGLSSDPPMNWRLSGLDRYTLVSSSDAHSPPKLGREANLFDGEPGYDALVAALRGGAAAGFLGTIEFFPEEGKYHFDGHRACGVRLGPAEARAAGGRCPECGKPMTDGVLSRVEALADRPDGARSPRAAPFRSLIPLAEVLGEIHGVGPGTRTVAREYERLLAGLGPELELLRAVPPEDVGRAGGPLLAEAVRRMRAGAVRAEPGYDGEYGKIAVFEPGERDRLGEQAAVLLPVAGIRSRAGGRTAGVAVTDDVDGGPRSAFPASLHVAETESPGPDGGEQTSVPRSAQSPPVASPELDPRQLALFAPAGPTYAPGPVTPAGRVREAPPEGWTASSDGGTAASGAAVALDPDQRRAVETGTGPLLIVAGPGSGKTRVLTHRIAHLVAARGVPPDRILAVTFTRRAARELAERLGTLLPPDAAARVTVRTLHALGLDILDAELAGAAGVDRTGGAAGSGAAGLEVYDDAAALELLTRATGLRGAEARRTADAIADAKERLFGPDEVAGPEVAAAYRVYQAALEAAGALDYGDLIRRAVAVLRERADACTRWRERFPWILVDEYQDVSGAQHALLRLLAPPAAPRAPGRAGDAGDTGDAGGAEGAEETGETGRAGNAVPRAVTSGPNLTVVGDPDQAIYGFRGADPRHTARFAEEYAGAAVVRLRRNYRSTGPIVRVARQALTGGRDDADSVLRPRAPGGPLIRVYDVATEAAEAETIVHAIERLVGGTSLFSIDSGRVESDEAPAAHGFGDVAVLYRTHAQAPALEEAFSRPGIPYQRVSTPPDERAPFDPRAERVALMTLHAAKGLEFPVVFIAGCEARLLPYERPGAEPADVDEAEERRLFYVGLTRARRLLILTRARRRVLYGRLYEPEPSPFLAAIDPALLEVQRPGGTAARRDAVQLGLFGAGKPTP